MTPPHYAAEYDYVIVGAGSAGCAVAFRLSQGGKHSVLLLESGGSDKDFLIRMPRGIGKTNVPHGKYTWTYQASQGGNRGDETWLKGHVLGGSSSINGMVYLRGFAADYDRWLSAGCTGWGWNEIGRCYREMEDHALAANAWRGNGGPLKVSLQKNGFPLVDALIAAAGQLGVPRREDVNDVATGLDGGIAYQPATIHRGERVNAARAFLDPVRQQPNLTVSTGATASRILFEGKRAIGVAIVRGAGEERVRARREVVVCAGSIESPRLLQLSGIGPAALLASCGVEPRHDAPEVGRNLIEHRLLQINYRVAGGSTNHQMRGLGLLRSVLSYGLFRRGVMTHAAWEGTGFFKSDPALEHPDGQIGIGLYSLAAGVGHSDHQHTIDDQPGLSISICPVRPQSRGELKITGADRNAPLSIDANYFAVEEDRKTAAELARWVRRMMQQPALAAFQPREISPGANCVSDDDLIEAYLTLGTTGYHVSGTCRMGADPTAVLDPRLRVRGIEGLRVADLSIIPSMVSGNTNAAAMVIGFRAGEIILQDAINNN